MFQNALITRVGTEGDVDIGVLAESMFFYDSVQLLLDRGSILTLATALGRDDTLSLLDRPEIKVSYLDRNFVVVSGGLPRTHQFTPVQFLGLNKSHDYRDSLTMSLERTLGVSGDTHRFAKALIERLKLHKFKGIPEKADIVPKLAREDVLDDRFTRQATREILRVLAPSYAQPDDLQFRLVDVGQGYLVDTNIDFKKVNTEYHRYIPPSHSSLSSEYILANILSARADTYFAAEYMAEIVTSRVHSALIRLKHFDFLRRRENTINEVDLFQDMVLSDFHSIREVINRNERSISEFLKLLDEAQKFKHWLKSSNPDAGLIQSYYQEATKRSWADRLPPKTIRFAIATGLGAAADLILPTGLGTTAGVATGMVDTFMLDKLIQGWRPNHFIEGPYRDFVGGS